VEDVLIEQVLPDRPEVVFDWLTEPDLLTAWWPDEAAVDLRVGGDYHMYWSGSDATLRGSFRVVERPARLAYTWSWDHDALPPRDVDIELAAEGDGTRLVLRHEAGSDDEAGDYRDGWTFFLDRLDEALRHR